MKLPLQNLPGLLLLKLSALSLKLMFKVHATSQQLFIKFRLQSLQ